MKSPVHYPLVSAVIVLALSCQPGLSQSSPDRGLPMQKHLGVPSAVATVQDSWLPRGERFPEFVLIQDIHRHPEVQRNIAAILLHGVSRWGIQTVYIEGSWAEGEGLSPAATPLPTLRDAVQSGRMSGAELAKAMAPDRALHLLGLEDPRTYRENVDAYERVQGHQQDALRELKTTRLLSHWFDLSQTARWERVERLIRLRLKPSEYAEYRRDPFRGTPGSQLAEAVAHAERFYEIADTRSQIFVHRATASQNAGPRVLVVGGFHTGAMVELLKKDHRSYVVLTPKVTQAGYDDLYARGMVETISALKLR